MFKATNIATTELIFESAKEMQAYTEAHYNADNPACIVDRANNLEVYMALSGKLLADAKYHYNDVLNSIFIQAVKDGNSAKMATSTMNKYIDSLVKDYQYLVDWLDRINRTCTHQLDVSRSLLSKMKEEMRISQGR